MAIQDQTIIQFSRSKDIESSREHAILRLDTGVTHHPGQPVVVRYYTDSNRESVNIIYAIGIKDGKGRDCYSIVSLGQNNLIWGISKEVIPYVIGILLVLLLCAFIPPLCTWLPSILV